MKGKQLAKLIGGLIMVGIVVLAVFYYLNQRPDDTLYAKEGTKNTEAQQIIAKDLDNYYPASVREVVRLYSRISKCCYVEVYAKDEFSKLIQKQRTLFSEELLENNPLPSFTENFRTEIETAKNDGTRMISYRVQQESSVKKWTSDGTNYASIVACFMMKEKGEDYKYSYEEFILKEEKNRWKILGWRLTNPIEIIE